MGPRGQIVGPSRSSLRLVASLKAHNALDNREGSSPVEDGARGVAEGGCIVMKCQKSKRERGEHTTLHNRQ